MKPYKVAELLKSYGFQNLKALKSQVVGDKIHNIFSFDDINLRLFSVLGEASRTPDGVLVYGRGTNFVVGIKNDKVKVITKNEEEDYDDESLTHLEKLMPQKLTNYWSMLVTDSQRAKFTVECWKIFNKEKFSNRLDLPVILVAAKHQAKNMATALGVFTHYSSGGGMQLFISTRTFKKSFSMYLEVLLHEMCHQATATISNLPDNAHGEVWQHWMTKVGLDPKRFSYKDFDDNSTESLEKESDMIRIQGPKDSVSLIKKLVPLKHTPTGKKVAINMNQRIWVGVFSKAGSKYVFQGYKYSNPSLRRTFNSLKVTLRIEHFTMKANCHHDKHLCFH